MLRSHGDIPGFQPSEKKVVGVPYILNLFIELAHLQSTRRRYQDQP